MVVAIVYYDQGPPVGGEVTHEGITHRLPIGLGDDYLIALLPVREEVELFAEVARQVITNERGVILDLAHLKQLGAARFWVFAIVRVSPLDIAQQLIAEVVRIQPSPVWLQHACMEVREGDHFRVGEVERAHNLHMPVRCPALIGNLRLHHRVKPQPLIADDLHHIALPLLQARRVRGNKAKQVTRGFARRTLRHINGQGIALLPEVVVCTVRLRVTLRRVGSAIIVVERATLVCCRAGVYVLLNRERGIKRALHGIASVVKLVTAQAVGIDRDRIEHPARSAGVVGVVGEVV